MAAREGDSSRMVPQPGEFTIGVSSPVVASGANRQEIVTASYHMGDVKSLVQAHDEIDLDNVAEHPETTAGAGGDYVKAFVFGGLDGIVSTFALVASMGGANIDLGSLIAVGLAKVLADALSMGFGEFTSATAELEQTMALKAREEWETDNHMDGEVKEMCELYIHRGCAKEDALTIMTVMSKYKELFIEHMLAMEHGVLPPDAGDKWGPLKNGFVCFFAFVVFGLVPLAGFIILYAAGGTADELWQTMLIAYGLTAAMLFTMGYAKAYLTGNKSRIKSGIMMLVNGTVAGGVAYLLGEILTSALQR